MTEKMNEVINALVSATDLREGTEVLAENKIALEAFKGLSTIIPNMNNLVVKSHTFTLLLRVRYYLENVC